MYLVFGGGEILVQTWGRTGKITGCTRAGGFVGALLREGSMCRLLSREGALRGGHNALHGLLHFRDLVGVVNRLGCAGGGAALPVSRRGAVTGKARKRSGLDGATTHVGRVRGGELGTEMGHGVAAFHLVRVRGLERRMAVHGGHVVTIHGGFHAARIRRLVVDIGLVRRRRGREPRWRLGGGDATRVGGRQSVIILVIILVEQRRAIVGRLDLLEDFDALIREGLGVVELLGRDGTTLLSIVIEGTEPAAGATLRALPIDTRVGLVVGRVVELLLATVGVGALETERAAVLVIRQGLVLIPEGARLRAVADVGDAAEILVGVRVDATMPVMLDAVGAPQGLEVLDVEIHGLALLVLLVEQLGGHLRARVRESTELAAEATLDVRVGGAETLLEHVGVVQELKSVVAHVTIVSLLATDDGGIEVEMIRALLSRVVLEIRAATITDGMVQDADLAVVRRVLAGAWLGLEGLEVEDLVGDVRDVRQGGGQIRIHIGRRVGHRRADHSLERVRGGVLVLLPAVRLPGGAVDVRVARAELLLRVSEAASLLSALLAVAHAGAVLGGVVRDFILGMSKTAIGSLGTRCRAGDELARDIPIQELVVSINHGTALLGVEMVVETNHGFVLLAMAAFELGALGSVAIKHGVAMLKGVEFPTFPLRHLVKRHVTQLLGTLLLNLDHSHIEC